MDIERLAGQLLQIVKSAAPLVGASEEVEAGLNLLAAAKGALRTIKDALAPDKAAELEAGLVELAAKVNAHADRTASSLD
ncbi:MAG TPA: hypothetical protein VM760_08915 [Sphingomicrobium sp.]|jgi:hypothetical protein|nr:hypothetical protein [Sphingomicrobium sp.]